MRELEHKFRGMGEEEGCVWCVESKGMSIWREKTGEIQTDDKDHQRKKNK